MRGYAIEPDQMDHALRAVRRSFHGFATLQAAHGFQWSADVDESFGWLVDLVDQGLRRSTSD
ncbi:TetR-like C-terminal domain-containing protein [Saccharopolyspora kobensis]|nr:TetR-like C-terminal domain-containing protein [Saccharopolyspora kobensis]